MHNNSKRIQNCSKMLEKLTNIFQFHRNVKPIVVLSLAHADTNRCDRFIIQVKCLVFAQIMLPTMRKSFIISLSTTDISMKNWTKQLKYFSNQFSILAPAIVIEPIRLFLSCLNQVEKLEPSVPFTFHSLYSVCATPYAIEVQISQRESTCTHCNYNVFIVISMFDYVCC